MSFDSLALNSAMKKESEKEDIYFERLEMQRRYKSENYAQAAYAAGEEWIAAAQKVNEILQIKEIVSGATVRYY